MQPVDYHHYTCINLFSESSTFVVEVSKDVATVAVARVRRLPVVAILAGTSGTPGACAAFAPTSQSGGRRPGAAAAFGSLLQR